ncbi:MAG: diacylglycerol kinase family protein [bacterium]|nr:diacylglycerol kinase family protein [bacterium]
MDGLRNHKIYESFGFAFCGIWQAIKTERNVKIELCCAYLSISAGVFFRISKPEWMALIIMIFAVISAEIFNSAVEAVCNEERDRCNLPYKETRLARDIAAGAVLFLSIGAVILGLVIFTPYLLKMLNY